MAFISLLKMLYSCLPFIKEMFFDGQDLKQLMMKNKLVAVLIIALISSIFINYVSISKIFQIAVHQNIITVTKPAAPASAAASAASHKNSASHNESIERLRKLYND